MTSLRCAKAMLSNILAPFGTQDAQRIGSLYPALHRLEHQGWITAEWGASENNRRARFYALTKAGRKQLEAEVAKWERLSTGVNLGAART